MKTHRLLGCLLLATTVCFSSVGYAGDPAKLKAASDSFAAGARAFEDKRFEEAAAHFEAADAAAPSPQALRLAIRSRLNAGQEARAATLSALALELHPTDEELSKLATTTVESAGTKLHKVAVSCASPCLLAAGAKIVHGEPRTRWTLFLEPGSVVLGASFVGRIAAEDQTIKAVAGKSSNVRFEPKKDGPASGGGAAAGGAGGGDGGGAAKGGSDASGAGEGGSAGEPAGGSGSGEEPTPAETSSGGIHPAFFIVGSVLTAGLGGTAIWSGIDTVNNPGEEAVKAACAGKGEDCPLYQEAQDKELRTNILIGATAGVAAVSVVLAIVTDWGGGEKPVEPAAENVTFDWPRLWLNGGGANSAPTVLVEVGGHFL